MDMNLINHIVTATPLRHLPSVASSCQALRAFVRAIRMRIRLHAAWLNTRHSPTLDRLPSTQHPGFGSRLLEFILFSSPRLITMGSRDEAQAAAANYALHSCLRAQRAMRRHTEAVEGDDAEIDV